MQDLIKDLKSELGGKFEDVIVGLMSEPVEYLCQQLNKSMKGAGCDEMALIEILCTRNNNEIKKINETYERCRNYFILTIDKNEILYDYEIFTSYLSFYISNWY